MVLPPSLTVTSVITPRRCRILRLVTLLTWASTVTRSPICRSSSLAISPRRAERRGGGGAAAGVAAGVVAQQVADGVQVELLGHAGRRLRPEHPGQRRLKGDGHYSTPTCRGVPAGPPP